MDESDIAEAIAHFLKGRDDIATAEMVVDDDDVFVEMRTQGGVPYLITVGRVVETT